MGLRATLAHVPPLLYAAEKAEAGLARLKWRIARRPLPAGELRLHLGCGDIDHPGFVNIDARPRPHVHYVQAIDSLQRFASDSAVLVYSSHCLEHVPHGEVVRVLAEWRRVLRPGGVVRLSVPDFDHIVDAYLDSGRDMDCVQMPLMGEQNYAFNFHYTAFSRRSLEAALLQAGFSEVRGWTPGTDAYSSLPDWSGRSFRYRGKTYPISLNLEALK